MVLDIEKYPEFVPWCIEGKIHDKNESEDLISFNGDLKVGKSILNETFFSQVAYYKEKDKINKLLDYLKLKYVKSSTNFVFFESKKHIDILSKEMLDKGVIVGRPFPPFYDWCRISTGTSEEVDKFINGMLEVYS